MKMRKRCIICDKDLARLYKAAEMLLSPIGLRCTWNLFECAVLRDGKLATVITVHNAAFSAVFSCPEFLIYMMMRRIVSFAFNDNEHSLIRNPYFGCNTLEEALVKSDLMKNNYDT